jgi:hypothetical protein
MSNEKAINIVTLNPKYMFVLYRYIHGIFIFF